MNSIFQAHFGLLLAPLFKRRLDKLL